MIHQIDTYFHGLLLAHSAGTIGVALFFTYLGEVATIGFFTALMMLWLWWKNKKIDAIWFGVTIAVAGAAIWILKHLFSRPRPPFGLVAETSASFPSGHALSAVVFFLCAWYLFSKIWPGKNKIIGIKAIVLILLISWSRLALGVHWMSDIIGGWVIGAIFVYISIWVYRKYLAKI